MAVTLDAAHAAAQSNQYRQPICEILSCETVASIPFNGEFLSTSATNEQHPATIMHSTGRLIAAYLVGTSTIRYSYTDAARTFYTTVDFSLGSGRVGGEVAVCERADASVGIVWVETYGGNTSIKYRIVTVLGVDLSPAVTGTILTQASTAFLSGPAVAKLADDTYILVYGAQDGDSHYHLYRRTSSDFTTWAAAAEITLSGLADANRKAHPALLEIDTGALWLAFDYLVSTGASGEELTNAYWVTSTDKLASVSAVAAFTGYTGYEIRVEHPAMAQKVADQLYVLYDKIMASMHMDKDTTGWAGAASIGDMHFDTATQKLYVVNSYGGMFYSVVQIDVPTMTIDKQWTTSSSPAFSAYLAAGNCYWNTAQGSGHYVVVGKSDGYICVLDTVADSIAVFAFNSVPSYGVTANVTFTGARGGAGNYVLEKFMLDADAERIYCLMLCTNVWSPSMLVGYIDISGAGPNYPFTIIYEDTSVDAIFITLAFAQGNSWWEVVPTADIIIVSVTGANGYSGNGYLNVYNLSAGGLYKHYTLATNPTFPKWGLRYGIYNNGVIAGSFLYTSLYGQADYRGLCLIDLATDTVTYSRPSWATVNSYGLGRMALTDTGAYLINASGYGVTKYDGVTWTLYSNTTLPGLTPVATTSFIGPVAYNSTNDTILSGIGDAFGTQPWSGFVMFAENGYLKQSTYRIGTYAGGSWSWSTAAALVQGYTDYEAVATVDPSDSGLYVFWTNKDGTELSIKWDKEQPAFDLSDYLVRGEEITRSASIDPHTATWDSELNFTVSHGHLFDPSNSTSLLRQYLTMGRKITQRFGDTVGGVDYYEPYRHFAVSNDGEIAYERGKYPAMRVSCETPRRRWSQIHLTDTELYNTTPELIITDLLTTYAGISVGNISLGTWTGSKAIPFQAVDVSLGDAVDQIALHFGYSVRDGASGIIEAVRINDAGTVSQAYSDNTKIMNHQTHNKLANLQNKWIVECEEQSFIELLMQEELAAEFTASHRWNTGHRDYRINYTQGNKIFRNPRLEVVESVTSLAFDLAGSCSETLSDISHTEADQNLWDTYCIIEVDSPDLTAPFIASLAGLVSSYWWPDWLNLSAAQTVRFGSYFTAFWIFLALNILAATGNFQYRIYGQPVVKVRRKLQAEANDTALQVKMGQTIAGQKTEDPLCGSVADCKAIAEYQKMINMGERARWSGEKLVDLRNEEGDTISVIHPVSGQVVTIFLTNNGIRYLMPTIGSDTGAFNQTFEGWRR